MKPNDGLDSFAETKYKISSTGVRGSYFLNSSSGNTPYITAGIGTIKVDADSRISGLSIFPDETRSISESKALFETKAGYQFAGANLSENTKFQIRLGLGYSTGSGFEHKIGQTQLGIKDKLDIKDGMTLEADAGIMF
jgi:opacity protein-like surface antigen